MALKLPHNLTRRGFVAGVAATTATAAALLTLDGCSSGDEQQELIESIEAQFPDALVSYLDVDPTQVLSHTTMNMVDGVDYAREVHSFKLPLGSLVYQSSDTHALVIAPGVSSKALIRFGLVEFASGVFTSLLDQALGANEDYIIYDARASASAVAWVECNMVQGRWRVFATVLPSDLTNKDSLQQAVQQARVVEEGEASYAPPHLAVSDTKIYWTVMPDPNGPASSNDSYLKAVELGAGGGASAEPRTVYTSHGRMITTPLVSGGVLTIVPRVDTELVQYQLTTLDLKTDAVRTIGILPPSLRVTDAVWLQDGFAFSIEGNYDYAQGLSKFGTYKQLGNGQYLYVNKAPVSAVAQIGSLTFVKSTKNVLGLDQAQGNVAILGTLQDCIDYGDLLAGVGEQKRLVVYTTVISRIGQERGDCYVRVFELL